MKANNTNGRREKKTPGTLMAEQIRARANKLTDAERETLTAKAMRIIYGTEGTEEKAGVHAHADLQSTRGHLSGGQFLGTIF